MEYRFVWVNGHIEVYDQMGRFCFSADNKREAMEELEDAALRHLLSVAIRLPEPGLLVQQERSFIGFLGEDRRFTFGRVCFIMKPY